MIIWFLRSIFVIVLIAVLFVSLTSRAESGTLEDSRPFIIIICGLAAGIIALLVDFLTPKKSLAALAGIFFGLLVGIVMSWAMSAVLDMINDVYNLGMGVQALQTSKWLLGICICYLVISIVIRTKDDVRFVIPYVEFAKQSKGQRPLILDTSVIIDGRIADLCESRLFDAPLIIPRFVLNELQLIADSADKLKRNRGRRGLDMLNRMQSNPIIDVRIDDTPVPVDEDSTSVDHKLVAFTKACDGRLVTNDFNLNKVAQLREVDVININDVANSLKTIVLPGETMQVKIVKPGEEAQQGVGYLADGTMVVVEEGRNYLGQTVLITVTSSLQTSAGRMIFGRYESSRPSSRQNNNRTSERRPFESGRPVGPQP
jgi:uncharacterized protein YacL